MTKFTGSTSGAKILHALLNKTPHRRVWSEKERELKWLAEKWSDDGVPFEEILVRIADLRKQMGGVA